MAGLLLALGPPASVDGQTVDPLALQIAGDAWIVVVQPDGKLLIGGSIRSVNGIDHRGIARLNSDGSLDGTFNVVIDFPGQVDAIALQPDGRIVIGGSFASLGNGVTQLTRNGIARLNADGSVDTTFNLGGLKYVVSALAVQPDGKIVAGGGFQAFGGITGRNIVRLNPDGSIDTAFQGETNERVEIVLVQPNGQIVVGGAFTTAGRGAGETLRRGLARFNADGSLDLAFDPGIFSGEIQALAFQADGRIVVGGAFSGLGNGSGGIVSTGPRNLGRINANGSLDASFDPGVNSDVESLAVQTDGKIVVGGSFLRLGGGGTGVTSRKCIGRLNLDGSIDPSFNPGANSNVVGLAIQEDGRILLAGRFTMVGGGGTGSTIRVNIARLSTGDAVTQDLAVSSDGSAVTWLRGGAGPEVSRVTFEASADGSTFTLLGDAGRVAGGWRLTGLALPTTQNVVIRARGYYNTGWGNASWSILESTTSTQPPPVMGLDHTALQFAAASNGAAFTSQTPAQKVKITQSGSGAVAWTATSNQPWLTVSPASGTGSATMTIGVKSVSGLPASGSLTGTVTLVLSGAAGPVGPIPVTLKVVASTAPVSPPFGVFDTPAGDATVLAGSIAVTGWTLDDIGVQRVELWRDLQAGETTPPFASTPSDPRNGKVFIANASFVDGARPDVEALYPTTPFSYRAGWGYLLLTWGLANQGNGTYKLYAFGIDQENHLSTIGSKTIVVSNNTATKPFGSIDTPAIGGSPAVGDPNFGWRLTPKVNGAATCKIPSNGVQVSIDSGPLQPVVYGDARTDIAGAFSGFSNSTAAGGHYIFDWSTLTNGAHTIGWLITDDCNRADGVGSRFFNVTTGSSLTAAPVTSSALVVAETESDALITVARGYGELPEIVDPGIAGSRIVEIKYGSRIELRTPGGFDTAYQLANGERRGLPVGSTWDAASGTFSWQPAPGFLGRYRFVFSNGHERLSVRVVVTP